MKNKDLCILVTGGLGFVGSNFIHYMLDNHPSYKIINLDDVTYAANFKNLKDIENNLNYHFVRGNICDSGIVDKVVKNVQAVVHFAAESHVDRSITGPAVFIKTNVMGTQVLLDACVKYNKRFHYVSTDEIFGALPLVGGKKFDENTNYAPSSPYSASKAASDHLVRAYVKTYGLGATITNSSNNYGAFQYKEKFIPTIIKNALENRKIPVYGNGKNIRDWINVIDHCRAIDLVLHKGKRGETFLVGGNYEISNIDLVKKILQIMNKPESLINFVPDRLGHDLRYAVSSKKIERELGWKREVKFEDGLRDMVMWYVKNRSWL